MMQNGELYRLPSLVRLISGRDYSLWPTPTATDGRRLKFSLASLKRQLARNQAQGFQRGSSGGSLAGRLAAEFDYYLTPEISEYLMGFPMGWTDLER